MAVVFLNYRNGKYEVANGVLVDTYMDGFDIEWAEIAFNGAFVNVELVDVARVLPVAA